MIGLVVSEYVRPNNLDEAYVVLNESKKNRIVAGGAWIKLTLKSVEKLISLENLNLNRIVETKDSIEIGSMVTLHEVEKSPFVSNLYDGILSIAIHQIMGITIRNIATIGGSIMGRYSFSDVFPALLAMNTKLEFHKIGIIDLEEFIKMKSVPSDILTKIIIKKQSGNGFFKKVATTPLDFSIINVAVSKDSSGFKVIVGSTPYIAVLAKDAMEYLNQQNKLTDNEIDKAVELMMNEIHFNKNIRSSKEYKEELAKVYVKRGIKKVMKHEG